MGKLVEVVEPPKGKVWFCGDIHGCLDLLLGVLNAKGFNFEEDLLICTGDLVDRGDNNLGVIQLLSERWFMSVRGNHEDLAIQGLHNEAYARCHKQNGGEWFYQLDGQTMYTIAKILAGLPLMIEINVHGKKFVVAHADYPYNEYHEGIHELLPTEKICDREIQDIIMWDRVTIQSLAKVEPISGVDLMIHGHSVTRGRKILKGNQLFIDYGGCFGYGMCVVSAEELIETYLK